MAPMKWRVFLAERPVWQRPKPQLIIKPLWQRRVFWREANVAVGGSRPDVHFANGTNGPGTHQLHHPPIVFAGMNLRAHLGNALFRRGDVRQGPHFGHFVRQWFFAIQMAAGFHRGHTNHRVGVVRRTANHRVEFGFLEHLAEVAILLSCRKILGGTV